MTPLELIRRDALRDTVSRLTGLRLQASDDAKLLATLTERINASGASGPEDYLARLDLPCPAGQSERRTLVAALVPPETYFFRDAGQIGLLRRVLLPDRIQARQDMKVLRLWSAGCSTGEEAYTLAILASEALPRHAAWQVGILGSDISSTSLAKARAGRYGAWSFRGVDDMLRNRYFTPAGNGEWQLCEDIRRMVRFAEDDLLAPAAAALHGGDFDIVLCRNLLIYLQPEPGRHVLARLAGALAPGGYLMLGHNEGMESTPPELEARMLAESVVYRPRQQNPAPPLAAAGAAAQPPRPAPPHHPLAPPPLPAPTAEEKLRQAWTDANAGRAAAARAACEALIAQDVLAPEPYYLLAHLEEEAGDRDLAMRLLKRVIYLAPDHAMAYFDLATLHGLRGEADKARRNRATAQHLLEGLPPHTALPPLGEHTAGEVLAAARRTVSDSAEA